MSDQLPGALRTAYQDLLDRHERRPTPEYEGAPRKVERSERAYWVLKRRSGSRSADDYLGPDTPEMAARVAAIRDANEALKRWKADCASIVSMLRHARSLAPDSITGRILARLAEADFFRRGGVVGGTHAFRCYPLMLGRRPPGDSSFTDDVDLFAPANLRLMKDDGHSLIDTLSDSGLKVEMIPNSLDPAPLRWLVNDKMVLDVLSPLTRGGDRVRLHDGLQVRVQALPYLEYALEQPVEAVALYREGALIRIPSPERFALHKLLVSSLRPSREAGKASKDRAQAAWLIDALADERPFETAEAWADLVRRGRKWERRALSTLERMPETRSVLQTLTEEFGNAAGSLPD